MLAAQLSITTESFCVVAQIRHLNINYPVSRIGQLFFIKACIAVLNTNLLMPCTSHRQLACKLFICHLPSCQGHYIKLTSSRTLFINRKPCFHRYNIFVVKEVVMSIIIIYNSTWSILIQ